jgi:hypothetical protein
MATTKTKGTNSKIKELKVDKPEKISEDQLKRVQTTVGDINRFQMEIGSMETRKHNLLHNIAQLNDQLTLLRNEFDKEYGTTDINIETGEIKYTPNEQTDKKD